MVEIYLINTKKTLIHVSADSLSACVQDSENISVTKTEENPATMELPFSWERWIANKPGEHVIHSRN